MAPELLSRLWKKAETGGIYPNRQRQIADQRGRLPKAALAAVVAAHLGQRDSRITFPATAPKISSVRKMAAA